MFQFIYYFAKLVIIHPAEAWKKLKEEKVSPDSLMKDYYLPLLLINLLVIFIASLYKSLDAQELMKNMILYFLSSFLGLFLSVYLIKEVMQRKYSQIISYQRIISFVICASTLMLIINIPYTLFPLDLFVIKILNLYIIYIIFQGLSYLEIEETNQAIFVILSSVSILFSPELVRVLLTFIMPGMKI